MFGAHKGVPVWIEMGTFHLFSRTYGYAFVLHLCHRHTLLSWDENRFQSSQCISLRFISVPPHHYYRERRIYSRLW